MNVKDERGVKKTFPNSYKDGRKDIIQKFEKMNEGDV